MLTEEGAIKIGILRGKNMNNKEYIHTEVMLREEFIALNI